jgi:hypothetical protein
MPQALYFNDEQACVVAGTLPAAGYFQFTFRIPASMSSGCAISPANPYNGGGLVGPGPGTFQSELALLPTPSFDVTTGTPGWDNYTSMMSTVAGPVGYGLTRADGFLNLFAGSLGGTPVGNLGNVALRAPIVASAFSGENGGAFPTPPTTGSNGYWLAAADGGVFAFGDAAFYGSMGGRPLNSPIVGMAATPDGKGYWLAAADGGVFAFGDAAFYGSMGGRPINAPIVGIATPFSGGGYWLVGADGGVFAFGDAAFYGSMGGRPLDAPVVGISGGRFSSSGGYWLVGADGGVFAFGQAGYYGSLASNPLRHPAVGVAVSPDAYGYWILTKNGGVFSYGDAVFLGSAPAGT